MSSATSIKRSLPARARTTPPPHAPAAGVQEDAGFRPWHFFILASLMAATIAVIMSRQSRPEHLILISLTILTAGVAAAGFYRMLAPLATDDLSVFSETLSERTRATLEREKALTLRSIKELEFDRAMGKVSAKDFDEMAGRLRSRAISLMKQLDEGDAGYRTLIERELSARLAHWGTEARPAAPVNQAASPVCSTCGARNDADAAFCKRCGSRISPAGPEPAATR